MNKSSSVLSRGLIEDIYGKRSIECPSPYEGESFVFSQARTFDLIELEQLLQSVGWSNRPLRRVKKALDNSLLKVGLWKHDPKFPRLIGFARCTGDGILEATVWDVAINPVYQGSGFGSTLMLYVINSIKEMGIKRITLFADPGVINFYKSQGWDLEPKGNKCAFWYAN
ncbi:GNAT family N-acetyltransferase [Prochlorococcus sp. MIT 1223]|uniref:GNAT family N-acetyltransferase n=1 Tax=Prochlorococcus sp. MIT 1223 TaxID=3096217 RepID=UPI002A7561EE|nr:GNAT family N-acetyltransferase [Prochlorococcus sp. MIT 1223]